MMETGGLNMTSQERENDVGCENVEEWKGGAEERPCEIGKSLIRVDCLFFLEEIKEEHFLKNYA